MKATPRRITSVLEMSTAVEGIRTAGGRIALVPTMGALHDGHLALIRRAAELAETVVVSVFVNPTQFGPNEDYARYPRPIEKDVASLADTGLVDFLFAPAAAEMYPDGPEQHLIWIDTSSLDRTLCGAYRPGHFRAVATIVAKLFSVCRPHVAVFGLKDAQQYIIVSRMVADLNFGIEVVGVPTQREPGGLAMSTRNTFLTADEREEAVVLSQAVTGAARMIEGGETAPRVVEAEMQRVLSGAEGAVVQYASVVDAATLEEIRVIKPGQRVLSAVAVFFGSTRLIDNAFAVARAG